MEPTLRTYVHQYVSDPLGEGARVASAIVTCTYDGETATAVATLSSPANMVDAELEDAQTFFDLVDEELDALVALVAATWPPE
jgi:hypothetical protein